MNCPACQTDNTPAAKFCLNCGAPLPRVCANCGAALPAQAKFCLNCGAAQVGSAQQTPTTLPVSAGASAAAVVETPAADALLQRLQRMVPKEYAQRLLETRGKVGHERRQVTILFSDIKGSTAMAENLDPEEVLEIMSGAFDVLIPPIYRYEGTVARLMGDAILAFFGAPLAHENDPARAVRAALEIIQGAQKYAAQLERERGLKGFNVRVGINTGLVVVGEVGSDLRVEYTAMGDAINLAARLEQNAPVGGILISHDTYQHLRGRFDVQAQSPLSVKGKAEPVQVYTVLRARPRAFHAGGRGVEGVETPLVGREAEMEFLRAASDPKGFRKPLGSGMASFIIIVGDAGVGKSRLLFEFDSWLESEVQSYRPWRGRASAMTMYAPYSLLRDMFQERFKILESDSAAEVRQKFEAGIGSRLSLDQVHLVGHLLGLGFADTPAVQNLAGSSSLAPLARVDLGRYFHALAAEQRQLFFLEDLHWADEPTLNFIARLAQELPAQQALFIGLARPNFFERRSGWGDAPGFARLDLAPLSADHSRALVDAIFTRLVDPPQYLRQLIIERAEGNPFYLEELVMMLIGDGVIVVQPDGWRVELERLKNLRVPTTLVGVLQARLDSLSEAEKQVLQRAAVVGRRFWDALLAELEHNETTPSAGGPGELQSVLDQLGQRQLIFSQPRSAFGGTQEYLFKHAILHDVTYETVLLKLRRVYHYLVAGWLEAHCSERLDEYAGLIAGHYEQARETEKAAEWLWRAGEAALRVSDFKGGLAFLQRALALIPQDQTAKRLPLLGRLGYSLFRLGDYEQTEKIMRSVVELALPVQDWSALTRAYDTLSSINFSRGDAAEAHRFSDACLNAAQRSGAPILLAQALMSMFDFQPDEALAQRDLEQSLDLFIQAGSRDGQATCLLNLGNFFFDHEKIDQAAAAYEQGLEIFRQLGNRWGVANCTANLALVSARKGDTSKSIALYHEALAIEREIGDRESVSVALAELSEVYFGLGQDDLALTYARQSLAEAKAVGIAETIIGMMGRIAAIYARRGEHLRAAELVGAAQSHPAWGEDCLPYTAQALELLRSTMSESDLAVGLAQGRAEGWEAVAVVESG